MSDTKTEHEISLFEKIGGNEAIDAMVSEFYNRVLADSELAGFFEHSSMEALLNMQRRFFSAALGGPTNYSGKSIYLAHHGRGIKRGHFARFANHLLETLKRQGVEDDDVSDIIGRINTYVDEVVGGHGLAG